MGALRARVKGCLPLQRLQSVETKESTKATPQQDPGEYFLGVFARAILQASVELSETKKKWLVQTPAAEAVVEMVGEVAKAKEVKAEVQDGLSQGRHQRLGPARN
jgi:hypothetical protein